MIPNVNDLLAEYYHLAFIIDDRPLIESLLKRTGGPMLDLGCATGRTLEIADEMGFEAIGVDHSQTMIQIGQHLQDGKPRIKFIEANILTEQPELLNRIALTVIPQNTYSMLLEKNDRFKILTLISKYLRPDGLLYICVRNDQPDSNLSRAFSVKTPEGKDLGFELIQREDWKTRIRHYQLNFKLEERSNTYHFQTKLNTFEGLVSEFEQSEFEIDSIYGDPKLGPMIRNNSQWHFVLRKKKKT